MGLTFNLGRVSPSVFTDSSLNVGIGAAPSGTYKLEVTGTAKVSSTLLVSGAATFGSTITASGNLNLQAGAVRNINFYDSSNTNINAQIQYDQISATSGQLFFGTNNAGTFATRLTIASTGAATFSSSVTMGGDLALTPTDSAISFSSGAGRFFAGGAERLKIFSTGKIQSNSSIAGDVIADFRNTSSTGYGFAIQGGNDSGRYSLKVVNYNDSSTYFYVRGDGNVGIGTNSPTQILDVFGPRVRMGDGGGFELNFNTTTFAAFQLNGTERMRITSGGVTLFGGTTFTTITSAVLGATNPSFTGRNWSFGPNSSGDYVVYHNAGGGNTGVYLSYGGTSWTSNSDERLKTDLVPIEDAANKVSSLRSVIGRYNSDKVGTKRAFLIAQDLQKVLPEVVNVDKETGNLGVSYSEVIPLLVAAIKEQQAIITSLQDRLDKAGL